MVSYWGILGRRSHTGVGEGGWVQRSIIFLIFLELRLTANMAAREEAVAGDG